MSTVTRTRTRTHVWVDLANPYLVCEGCGAPVARFHDHERCGCGEAELDRHECGGLGTVSVCPSWGPVDGCQCERVLGRVDHGGPGEARREESA